MLASVDIDDVLSCDNPTDFYISWTSGIRVGKGSTMGASEILSYTGDVKYDVNSIALSSGPHSSADWKWHFEEGE